MTDLVEATERNVNVYHAKLAEQAERYDEMVEHMKKIAEDPAVEFTVEERNLLSVAYKNVVGTRRASWRILSTIEAKGGDDDRKNEPILRSYKEEIEKELACHCEDLLKLLDDILIPNCTTAQGGVFYQKMKGDYRRYLAEFQTGSVRRTSAEDSLKSYKKASDMAVRDLSTTHPLRLGLALNFSVFYYEILNAPDKACRLARAAFDGAVCDIDKLGESEYKDATLILQLLRDNITLWTSDMNTDADTEKNKRELQDVEGIEN